MAALLGAARGVPRAAPFRTSGGGPAANAKASITTRTAEVHGRCYEDGMAMSTLDEFLATIPNGDNRAWMLDILVWVGLTYSDLELRIAWNQSMFTTTTRTSSVLGRVQAHGDDPRARHHDLLRPGHERARHKLPHNARPPTLDQALRLRAPRRLHPAPALRQAPRHVVSACEVMNILRQNDTRDSNNLYN